MIQIVMNKGGGYSPFYVALEINQLILHNYMLDSRAEVNVIPYKVMNQLKITKTWQFGNVFVMDSRPIESKGVIENLKDEIDNLSGCRDTYECLGYWYSWCLGYALV